MLVDRIYVLHDHYRKRQHSSHYDLRILSLNKTFTFSFAFPKKKFPKQGEKLLVIQTPVHPLSILTLHGELNNGDKMTILEKGKCSYVSVTPSKIDIIFYGNIVRGHYILIKLHGDNWLIISKKENEDVETKGNK
jgi:hypothetical protein